MEKHLDQSEIDSMFASSRENTVKQETAVPSDDASPERKHVAYDFNRAGQINKEQMQAISTVNDLFARNLTHNMGAWLRTEFGMTLVSAEQTGLLGVHGTDTGAGLCVFGAAGPAGCAGCAADGSWPWRRRLSICFWAGLAGPGRRASRRTSKMTSFFR